MPRVQSKLWGAQLHPAIKHPSRHIRFSGTLHTYRAAGRDAMPLEYTASKLALLFQLRACLVLSHVVHDACASYVQVVSFTSNPLAATRSIISSLACGGIAHCYRTGIASGRPLRAPLPVRTSVCAQVISLAISPTSRTKSLRRNPWICDPAPLTFVPETRAE